VTDAPVVTIFELYHVGQLMPFARGGLPESIMLCLDAADDTDGIVHPTHRVQACERRPMPRHTAKRREYYRQRERYRTQAAIIEAHGLAPPEWAD